MKLAVCTLGIALLLVGSLLTAGETDAYWPQWRGPEGNGVAPQGKPPTRWSEERNVRWRTGIPGLGHSSPVVWGDRVFLTTAVETDQAVDPAEVAKKEETVPAWRRRTGRAPARVCRFAVIAVGRNDGKILWQQDAAVEAPSTGVHRYASWASHSPVTDGERVYAHFGTHGLYCYTVRGKQQWGRRFGHMNVRASFGEGSSPVLRGDSLVVNWDHEGQSFIVAMDKRTGETRWRKERDEPTSWSTPLVVVHEGRPQVVASATRVRSYELATGKDLWQCGGMTLNVVPCPVYGDGIVYVMSGFRGNALLAIRPARAEGDITGSEEAIAWKYEGDGTSYVPSPVLYGGNLYFLKRNDNALSCLDARTGVSRYEKRVLPGIKTVFSSPVAANDCVYVTGKSGTTYVMRHGNDFTIVATNTLEDSFTASPAVVADELYLRGHEYLYCLGAGD